MIAGERVLAAIPARGGSKTVPRKNRRELAGTPLVARAIDVAREAAAVDRTIVSTDDDEIARIARDRDAAVVERPARLAEDDSLVADALRHLVDEVRAAGEAATYLTMLEPTCPLRTSADVERCLKRLVDDELDSVATFTETDPSPDRLWALEDGTPRPYHDGANPWLPRQDQPDAYELTGGVYAFEIDRFPETGASLLFGRQGAVMMPPERSVDVDTEFDVAVAEALLEAGVRE